MKYLQHQVSFPTFGIKNNFKSNFIKSEKKVPFFQVSLIHGSLSLELYSCIHISGLKGLGLAYS